MKTGSFFYTFNDEMQKKFGCRVYKVSVDAGFTCPNRDGSKGVGGCIFCDECGSSSRVHTPAVSVKDQLVNNILVRRTRYGGQKFIAYFQSFTNTYAPIDYLKKVYDEAVTAHPDIVGLTISTRADCMDREKLELIASYRDRVPFVSIEYGLQTIHNSTLQRINRQETHEDFIRAIEWTHQLDLDHCVHVILGLPSETKEQILETADKIAEYQIRGVKIHYLVAMEKTVLANQYHQGLWKPLKMSDAISLTCDFLERLPENCVVYRIGGNGHPVHGVAPEWVWQKKKEVIEEINLEFQKRGTRQGAKATKEIHPEDGCLQ